MQVIWSLPTWAGGGGALARRSLLQIDQSRQAAHLLVGGHRGVCAVGYQVGLTLMIGFVLVIWVASSFIWRTFCAKFQAVNCGLTSEDYSRLQMSEFLCREINQSMTAKSYLGLGHCVAACHGAVGPKICNSGCLIWYFIYQGWIIARFPFKETWGRKFLK